MNKNGPIVIIDDDADDHELLQELFSELEVENEVVLFVDGESAIKYLRKPGIKPFLIISDIKMPRINGFELRKQISEISQELKITPFLYFTTGATEQSMNFAYSTQIQGLFEKPARYEDWKHTMDNIIRYWKSCMALPH